MKIRSVFSAQPPNDHRPPCARAVFLDGNWHWRFKTLGTTTTLLRSLIWLVLGLETLLPGATFTVTSTANTGNGTLRQAILNANLTAGQDAIEFNITTGGGGIKTISPISPLPPITDSVIINGSTQQGYTNKIPFIEINGTNAGDAYGLELHAGSNVIKALTINRFVYAGIGIFTNGNNRIESCLIGTDKTGTSTNRFGNGLTNEFDGILIFNSSDNIIGGTDGTNGNVLSGNGRYGVGIVGSLSRSNRIVGNFIGTDVSGLALLGNRDGIGIINSSYNEIGGLSVAARNVISGNKGRGIEMYGSGAFGNSVNQNIIGLDASGQSPLGNAWSGILIDIEISNAVPGPATSNTIGGFVGGNVISGNGFHGIEIGHGSMGNQLMGNIIGLSQDGKIVIGNQRNGIAIFDSTNNVIGGPVYAANYIVGNNSNGVFIGRGFLGSQSVSNVIKGNFISRNGVDGIQMSGGANANQVLGNMIGAGPGFGDVNYAGNFRHGVALFDATNNFIGGSDAQARNYISGNASNGVFIGIGSLGTGSISNQLQGNRIGTTPFGNGGVGVLVQGNWNFIGGTNAGQGNLIAFNGIDLKKHGHGVVIGFGGHNPILGNRIWGNSGRGIDLGDDSFTVNDRSDEDGGANDQQNYPVVTGVRFYGGGEYETLWTLNTKSNRLYRIEYFANSAPDGSGFGEGQRLIGTTTVPSDAKGSINGLRLIISDTDKFISATATDLTDMNTSEFAPVDTDGDAIADAWETVGIDYNEDGTNDLALAGANPRHKDIFVEVDAMLGRAPTEAAVGMLNNGIGGVGGFNQAPQSLVQNPDLHDGVNLHLELDEQDLLLEAWTNTWPTQFDLLKQGTLPDHSDGTFGKVADRFSANWLNIYRARRLVYRYCIVAEKVPRAGGQGELGGNDFYIAQGEDDDEVFAAAFMHELGHNLGFHHGGQDETNFKMNYHSIMNYIWTDRSSSYPEGWMLDYSREELLPVNEAMLHESLGLGGQSAFRIPIGPRFDFVTSNTLPVRLVPEGGSVDFNNNGQLDPLVSRDISFITFDGNLDGKTNAADASPDEVFFGQEDWSKITYYFLESPEAEDGIHGQEVTNDIPPEVFAELDRIGAGSGVVEFSRINYPQSETGGVATIVVKRTFEAEGNVGVSFSVFDGSATSGLDYTATNGVLIFTGAETNKIFTIPILNDGSAEEAETVRLVLSNPTGGASLGGRVQATLTIIDNDPPGDFTVLNTNNSGAGSLRQAMLDANASPGIGIIDFNIPGTSGLTISPTTALPTITNRITIDGTTQPGFAGVPIIELNGTSAGSSSGLSISAGHCTVRGLVINRFASSGINLAGPTSAGENRIEGCYIG